jgi:hypothetical protein
MRIQIFFSRRHFDEFRRVLSKYVHTVQSVRVRGERESVEVVTKDQLMLLLQQPEVGQHRRAGSTSHTLPA